MNGQPSSPELAPEWVQITSGPLKGHSLFFDPQAAEGWREVVRGRFEPFIYDALNECGGLDSMTMWDVGAHVGYHSLAFAVLVGSSGKVVAFEPNPYNVERFRMNLRKNPDLAERILLMTCALSNVDGEAPFVSCGEVDSGRSSGSHLDKVRAPEQQAVYESFDHTMVATIKADTLVGARRVPAPSIIKIDVEGAELLVLEGGVEILSSVKPILLIEVHNIVMMFYIQKLLTQLGYDIRILGEEDSSISRCFIVAKPISGQEGC